MNKLSKAILARDAKRDIGAEVLEAIREMRKFTVQVSRATEARIKLGQSQADRRDAWCVRPYAAGLGAEAARAEWSCQGVLKVAVAAPKTVRKVLAAA